MTKIWPDCPLCADFGVHIVDGTRQVCPYVTLVSNQRHPQDRYWCDRCGDSPGYVIDGAVYTICADCLRANNEPSGERQERFFR